MSSQVRVAAFTLLSVWAGLSWGIDAVMAEAQATTVAGVARVDITPEHPVRLSGYAARSSESAGVEQRLWAKAIALGSDAQGPAVLISFDGCVLPAAITKELSQRLAVKAKISRERLVLCCTHSHTAPCLAGGLPTLFGQPIPAEHRAHIEQYTVRLIHHLEQVALAALANRRSAQLAWGQGEVGFALNRRAPASDGSIQLSPHPGGPVDHTLPLLRVSDADGKVMAVLVNYACHCTTLGSEFNKLCGDWAGYAQQYVEFDNPGATCLVVIGCGADANPEPRLKLEHAQQHGQAVAREVRKLLGSQLKPLAGPPACRFDTIQLPFQKVPDRAEWQERLKQGGAAGYQAKLQLERLDRGEKTKQELPYPVQSWRFGSDLAMVFLGGEVVVDYAIRLKSELGAERLWVTAYANDVPCYIPSRRILAEGGYEATTSMIYYDQPGPLAPAVEELIVSTVREQLPEAVRAGAGQNPGK